MPKCKPRFVKQSFFLYHPFVTEFGSTIHVNMADDSNIDVEDENILYDLLINTEWPPETDTQLRGNKEHSSSVIAKAVTGPFRFILHYLWYSPSSSSLPPGLVRLANKQINWQLVLASAEGPQSPVAEGGVVP
ncbi:unnamed protein product [Oncorhynchus mykiss]|uniref:Uncharacterized protein n=1 Tax=Oncorhynchus mykiss TaxID=8022 RepID=A0A060YMC5_ONCMY|nr:unnamed protein product [Oncorhynchus mykiss]